MPLPKPLPKYWRRKKRTNNRGKKQFQLPILSLLFKYHDKCRKELTRDDRDTSVVGWPADGFKKVTSYVESYVLKINQVVSMNIVYEKKQPRKESKNLII